MTVNTFELCNSWASQPLRRLHYKSNRYLSALCVPSRTTEAFASTFTRFTILRGPECTVLALSGSPVVQRIVAVLPAIDVVRLLMLSGSRWSSGFSLLLVAKEFFVPSH
jgi:hypothetical protein